MSLNFVVNRFIKCDVEEKKKGSALIRCKFKAFNTLKIRLKNIIYSKTIRENLKEFGKVTVNFEALIELIDKGYFKMTCLLTSLKYIDFLAFIYGKEKSFESLMKDSWSYDKYVGIKDIFNEMFDKSISQFLKKQRNNKCLKDKKL